MNRIAVAAIVLTLTSSPLAADPRWWQHDRAITGGSGHKSNPDVTFSVSAVGNAGFPLFVTWQEDAALAAQPDVYVQASFDGGCTWCGPVLWATGPTAESLPRIAVGVAPSNGHLAVHVVFERDGEVLVAADASLDSRVAPATLCAAFAALRPPAPIRLSRIGGNRDRRPRIVAIGRQNVLHFHAAWESSGPAGTSLQYDHEVTPLADGSGWAGTGYRDLSLLTGEAGTNPDLSADRDVTGSGVTSAATVFYEGPGSFIRQTRSIDTGATWAAAETVSQDSRQTLPAADSSAGPFPSGLAWSGCAWQAVASTHEVTFDAAHWTAPLTRAPDFAAPGDELASSPPIRPGTAPAVAIGLAGGPTPGGTESPAFVFWSDDGLLPEVVARAGVLDPGNLGRPRDLDRFPFLPRRVAPPDPTVSTVEQLSACAWDDGWPALTSSLCAPDRRSGTGALAVAAADATTFGSIGGGATFVTVFADDRDGTSQVYLKATDPSVGSPTIGSVLPGCEDLRTARAEVTFPLLNACPSVPEWIDRYLVYYGSATTEGATPGGPFGHRVAVANQGLPDPARATVGGLNPGESYVFALLAEDQARNLNPQELDPRVATNRLNPGQVAASVDTPTCAPRLAVACLPGPDDCGGVANGRYNPGDTVVVDVTITNNGDWAASNVSGTIAFTAATVLSPPGGLLALPSIAAGGSQVVPVTVRLDPTCSSLDPQLIIAGTASDAGHPRGPVLHGDLVCPAVLVLDCSSSCTAACLVGGLSPIRSLLAAKSGPDALFAWAPDPAGPLYHHLNSVTAKDLIPRSQRPTAGIGRDECTGAAASCTVSGVITRAPDLIFFQACSACGDSGLEEGPL